MPSTPTPSTPVLAHSHAEEKQSRFTGGRSGHFYKSRIMMATIRKATPDDAKTLTELILELAAYERLLDQAEPVPELLREHLSEEALTGCEALIAETERGTAVGFALFYHNYSTFLTNAGLYVEDLFVKATYRGEGIGSDLLQHLAEIAEERGCRRMEWAVLDWNTEAVEFYEDVGAEPLDDWTRMRLDEEAIEDVAEGAVPSEA